MPRIYGKADFERIYNEIPSLLLVEKAEEFKHWVSVCFAQGFSTEEILEVLRHDYP